MVLNRYLVKKALQISVQNKEISVKDSHLI